MQYSPFVLLRHPSYDLSRMEVFSVKLDNEQSLEEIIEENRKHFLSFITSKDLLLSLLFSSKTVYQAIPHYEFHASVKIRKKEKQTERALTKYLSRMSLNATPLAAFAKSQFVDWEGNRQEPASNYFMSLSLTQRKEFFDLCYCDVGLQDIMRYRLNPSLHNNEQGFIYLYKEGEEESMVQLEADEQFEALCNNLVLKEFTFKEFVSQSDYDVNDFLESQLIIPSYPIYEDQELLKQIIESINERHQLSFKSQDVAGFALSELSDDQANQYQQHWEKQLKAFAKALDVGLDHKLYSERVYYLNTYSKNELPVLNLKKDEVANTIFRLISLADKCLEERNSNTLSWDTLYSCENGQEQSFDVSKVNLGVKSKTLIQIDLSAELPKEKNSHCGIMLQYSATDKPSLLNISTAHAKFFATSLNLANQGVKNQIEKWVKDRGQGKVCLKDDSLHSKNKGHSFLKELNTFGLDFNTAIENRVALVLSENGYLDAKKNESVSFVNLGIEDFRSRSTFYQNLYAQADQLPDISIFVQILQSKYRFKIDGQVSSEPRIETEALILGYQNWYCEKSAFEQFQNEKEIPVKILNEWRNKYLIPRVVQYSIDKGKAFFLDFLNPWSVDIFLKLIRKMESVCQIKEMGFGEEIKGKQFLECYFEVENSEL